ncbi:hypothetical protein M9Y10_016140 [Tritrichomonas musculus]|uniref:Protein kinase domain-containing protein n=1 Tax=Tritrichomonas musculus TaxID=1915356 RepID=A0ABR2I796_9EUKA
MKTKQVIVDPIHVFDSETFDTKKLEDPGQIYFIAQQRDSDQLFYLVKKAENFSPKTKNSFINYLEKSTELIHPSIINLSGYSIIKPYLYYKYSQEPLFINSIELTDENIQNILIGIASGLSYLSAKGYYFNNISFNSIIFDKTFFPKIFDYIDFENKSKCTERDMIIKYVILMQQIIKKKIDEDPTIPINDKLKALIYKFKNKTKQNLPTFDDFLNFFKNNSFRGNDAIYRLPSIQRTFEILDLQDILIFDDFISKKIDKIRDFDSIEQIVFYFLRNRNVRKKQTPKLSKSQIEKIEEKQKRLKDKHLFILNSLPEFYIRPLNLICEPLSHKQIRYLYNEDISLIIPNWKEVCINNYLEIYKYLMTQIKKLEKQKNQIFYFDEETKKLNYKIEAIRIKAIDYLKEESKQSNEGKIELAIQYIKNDILPINYEKALKILDSISNANDQTIALVNLMKFKIILSKLTNDDFIQNLPESQQKIYNNAKEGKDVLSMLYVAFAFYTGFNGFPIIRSLSIHYYKQAAKLSPDAMTLLGFLYLNGLMFPQNLRKARKCFKLAADNGSLKGEIIDGILRKHVWRSYLVKFEINDLFENYLQSFESMIPNDSFIFPKINYFIDNNFKNFHLYKLELSKVNKSIISDDDNKNQSMFLKYQETFEWEKNVKQFFSERILYPIEKPTNVKRALYIAKSYFYGDNNFPINYSLSEKYFKTAADNGDSEAQWRYALSVMNFNDSGYNAEVVEHYLQESAKQNNLRGKLYYAIILKQVKKENDHFEKIIKECCESKNLEAMYYYGMYLEDHDLEQSIQYYKNAADLGHFDSLIRLIQLLKKQIQKEQDKKEQENENNEEEEEEEEAEEKEKEHISLFNYYFELSAGILNENLLSDLIIFYDENEKYEQANTLIQIGILINHYRFNTFYIDHLMNGKGMEMNIIRAKKLALFYLQNKDQEQVLKYKEKYNYLLLHIFAVNNEHQKALEFLLKIKNELNENREEFHTFYKKFDKNLAKHYFIPACFYYEQFIKIYDILIEYYSKNVNIVYCFLKLVDNSKKKQNPFGLALLGKMYKEEKHHIIKRDLKKAIKFFAKSANDNCPLGCYYLGKEYYYGRYLYQDYEKAKELFLKAIKNNDEPRSGYYLYKLMKKKNKDEALKMLKIGVEFECKRALFTYSKLSFKGIIIDKIENQKLIFRACELNNKSAKKFCTLHGIYYRETKNTFESSMVEEDCFLNEESSMGLSEKQEVNKFGLVFLNENDQS